MLEEIIDMNVIIVAIKKLQRYKIIQIYIAMYYPVQIIIFIIDNMISKFYETF